MADIQDYVTEELNALDIEGSTDESTMESGRKIENIVFNDNWKAIIQEHILEVDATVLNSTAIELNKQFSLKSATLLNLKKVVNISLDSLQIAPNGRVLFVILTVKQAIAACSAARLPQPRYTLMSSALVDSLSTVNNQEEITHEVRVQLVVLIWELLQSLEPHFIRSALRIAQVARIADVRELEHAQLRLDTSTYPSPNLVNLLRVPKESGCSSQSSQSNGNIGLEELMVRLMATEKLRVVSIALFKTFTQFKDLFDPLAMTKRFLSDSRPDNAVSWCLMQSRDDMIVCIEEIANQGFCKDAADIVVKYRFEKILRWIVEKNQENVLLGLIQKKKWPIAAQKAARRDSLWNYFMAQLVAADETVLAYELSAQLDKGTGTLPWTAQQLEQETYARSLKFYKPPVDVNSVQVISTIAEVDRLVNSELQAAKFIALDCEWNPLSNGAVSVLQLGYVNQNGSQVVKLVDVQELRRFQASQYAVQTILGIAQQPMPCDGENQVSSNYPVFVGFGINEDLRQLSREVNSQGSQMHLNVLNLQTMLPSVFKIQTERFKTVNGTKSELNENNQPDSAPNNAPYTKFQTLLQKGTLGLSAYVESILQMPLDKAMQTSNWSKRPLTFMQRSYAIADVTALLDLMLKIVQPWENGGWAASMDQIDKYIHATTVSHSPKQRKTQPKWRGKGNQQNRNRSAMPPQSVSWNNTDRAAHWHTTQSLQSTPSRQQRQGQFLANGQRPSRSNTGPLQPGSRPQGSGQAAQWYHQRDYQSLNGNSVPASDAYDGHDRGTKKPRGGARSKQRASTYGGMQNGLVQPGVSTDENNGQSLNPRQQRSEGASISQGLYYSQQKQDQHMVQGNGGQVGVGVVVGNEGNGKGKEVVQCVGNELRDGQVNEPKTQSVLKLDQNKQQSSSLQIDVQPRNSSTSPLDALPLQGWALPEAERAAGVLVRQQQITNYANELIQQIVNKPGSAAVSVESVDKEACVAFVADVQLGKLWRQLRMLGYDTEQVPNNLSLQKTKQLAILSGQKNKIFLTRNRRIANGTMAHTVLLLSEHPDEQLQQLKTMYDITVRPDKLMSRCTVCNSMEFGLVTHEAAMLLIGKTEIKDIDYWRCCCCGQLFWVGTQSKNAIETLVHRLGCACQGISPHNDAENSKELC